MIASQQEQHPNKNSIPTRTRAGLRSSPVRQERGRPSSAPCTTPIRSRRAAESGACRSKPPPFAAWTSRLASRTLPSPPCEGSSRSAHAVAGAFLVIPFLSYPTLLFIPSCRSRSSTKGPAEALWSSRGGSSESSPSTKGSDSASSSQPKISLRSEPRHGLGPCRLRDSSTMNFDCNRQFCRLGPDGRDGRLMQESGPLKIGGGARQALRDAGSDATRQ